MTNVNFEFDNNNQDDITLNGINNEFVISDFVDEFESLNEFEMVDVENERAYYEY